MEGLELDSFLKKSLFLLGLCNLDYQSHFFMQKSYIIFMPCFKIGLGFQDVLQVIFEISALIPCISPGVPFTYLLQ